MLVGNKILVRMPIFLVFLLFIIFIPFNFSVSFSVHGVYSYLLMKDVTIDVDSVKDSENFYISIIAYNHFIVFIFLKKYF